jgi:hypothetical protein
MEPAQPVGATVAENGTLTPTMAFSGTVAVEISEHPGAGPTVTATAARLESIEPSQAA